jgi:Na+/proline symporter
VSWWLVWVVGYSTRITMITKVFAAKDTRAARISLPITDALFMLFLLYGNLYLGAAARVLVWDQVSENPDSAFPTLVNAVSALSNVPWLGAIALTGVVGAAIATADSLLLMSGAAIAHDLLRKCFYEPRGLVRDERFYLRISRATVLIVGVISFLGALRTPDLILTVVSYAVALVGVAFFFPMLLGMSSPRITARAATWSSVLGSLAALLWTALHLLGADWARIHVPWTLDLHPVVPGLVAAIVPMIVLPHRLEMSPGTIAVFFPELLRSKPPRQ